MHSFWCEDLAQISLLVMHSEGLLTMYFKAGKFDAEIVVSYWVWWQSILQEQPFSWLLRSIHICSSHEESAAKFKNLRINKQCLL